MADLNVPIGAIIPYCGPLTTNAEVQALNALGWLPCDGASYNKIDYVDLALSIGTAYGGTGGPRGTFNVPDLRGRFLRGTAHASSVDPDSSTRTASNPGGNTGNQIGSLQGSATALPKNPFQTAVAGRHDHTIPNGPIGQNAYAIAGSHNAIWNPGSTTTGSAGAHNHSLPGAWDHESRPVNVYVNFLIKFTDTP